MLFYWKSPADEAESKTMLSHDDIKVLEKLLDSGHASYPHTPICEIVLGKARSQPQEIAVSMNDRHLSYGDLLVKSQSLAQCLRDKGVKRGAVVGVCLPTCPELLLAIMSIWQLGAIYCPLDPTHPEAYMQHMLEQADPHLVLLHGSLSGLNCLFSRAHILLDTLPLRPLETAASIPVSLDDPAYLFFTSGTTGKPKGVLASQRNLAHYIHVAQQAFAFDNRDVFISIARPTFSISLFDLISPLCVGARLILAERHEILDMPRLLQLLSSATILHAGPSLLSSIFRTIRRQDAGSVDLSNLRHVSSGGDVVPASVMEDMKKIFSRAEIYVLYGSTEISCMGTCYPVSRHAVQTKSLVGRGFPDVKVRIVNDQLAIQPPGVIGEICFAGPGLALGYYKRPDLEKDKFISLQGERYYRMGDIGRLQPNGDLEMLGRQDFQIQLRGIRIELVGIENTIREIGLAEQCALMHKKDREQEYLIAVVVGPQESEIAAFRRKLARHLPEAMLPQQLLILDKMPLTVNGKLDRRALQDLPWQAQVRETVDDPHDHSLRDKLARSFARALNRETFGTDLNFFDEGGHSLLAVLLLQDLRETYDLVIPPQVFFAQATVQGILDYLGGGQKSELKPILLNKGPMESKLFMLGGVQAYRVLAQRLEDHFAAFAVFTLEELSATDANSETLSIARLSECYMHQIRALQPHGPYQLLGYSFAGIVAFEIAQRLKAAGETVSVLVLVDAIIPEWNNKLLFRWRQIGRALRTPPPILFRFLWRRMREKVLPQFSSLNQFRDNPRLAEMGEQRVLAKSVAAVSYAKQREPYGDPCLLIISKDRLRQDPLKSRTCGWADVMSQLEIKSVEGDHFTMIEMEPDVTQIAELVCAFHRSRSLG
ncbi:MAG TPA: AMP-binding protein [Oligoflexus sp.]|uniref:AMP-binding protein n=1 Tax=Oligoflexus sp. TaxID=1971216 RepID=UPI002D804782|nr:AMP-binding protein [Oligoflexus sp.]HET9238073.1 AMP-binding protein [Oligoflexus sp.]